jgi:S1-C subfamily serine protease
VLTAAHVVQSADVIFVVFPDGKPILARVTHSAVYADVALLQLERVPPGCTVARLGDSDRVEVGDEIMVVGAPYGLSHTLSVGHISGRYRPDNQVAGTSAVEFLQTDAAVNRGNSGGPMFNLSGEVVGIVSQIVTKSGGFEGIGLAATAKMVRQLLLDQKMFWSGVEGRLIEGDLARALNLPQQAGFLVQRVAKGSPAWRAGIRAGTLRAQVEGEELLLGGDIVLAVNGVAVEEDDRSFDQIQTVTSRLKEGENLTSKVLRDGKVIALSTTIIR